MNKKILWTIIGAVIFVIIVVLVFSLIPKKGTLVVNSNEEKTQIKINNTKYETPLKIQLKEGGYKLLATKDGFIDDEISFTIKYKQETKIDLTMVSSDLIEPSIIDEKLLNLEYGNDHFNIELSLEDKYDINITLLAINNGGMTEESDNFRLEVYNQQLAQYKKEALEWIKTKGTNPQDIKIQWFPEKAKDL